MMIFDSLLSALPEVTAGNFIIRYIISTAFLKPLLRNCEISPARCFLIRRHLSDFWIGSIIRIICDWFCLR